MPMTAKHYTKIAAILKDHHQKPGLTQREHTLLCSVGATLAMYFGDDNPSFDKNRFLDAAGALDYIDD